MTTCQAACLQRQPRVHGRLSRLPVVSWSNHPHPFNISPATKTQYSQQYRSGAQISTWRTFASVLFRSIGAYDGWLCCGLTEMGNRDNPRLSKIAHQLGNLKAITTYSTILKILFWRFITYHDLFCPQVRPSSVGSYSRRSSWCYQGGGDQTLVSENSHSDHHLMAIIAIVITDPF